jgi:hypothetical protein
MAAKRPRTTKPTDLYVRKSRSRRRIGLGAQCACGERRHLALIANSGTVTCYCCKRVADQKSTIDDHHIAGRSNYSATIPIPTNDHVAELSERQRDWPEQTLRNPDGDPFLKGAACVRGVHDTIIYIVDHVLLWVAHLLEIASALLTQMTGRFYWRNTPLEEFVGRRKS